MHKVDLLMIQEIKAQTIECIDGLHTDYNGEKQYNGVAIISKNPFQTVSKSLCSWDQAARYIEIQYNGINFINIYAPNGNPVGSEKFEYKLNWMQELHHQLIARRRNKIPTIIGGDFNVIPTDICCHDIEVWKDDAVCQPEVRDLYFKILANGYTDISMLNSQNKDFTFWSYRHNAWQQDKGARIDHILACPRILDICKNIKVLREYRALDEPSDHAPVIIDINIDKQSCSPF